MAAATKWLVSPPLLSRACLVAARRPASWIAVGIAAAVPPCAVAWMLPPAPCLLAAALACLAAVGDVPIGLLRPGGRGGNAEIVFWTCLRGLWPVAGLCLGAIVAGRQAAVPTALAGAALSAAAVSVMVSRLCGAKTADALAVVIVLAFCSAAASAATTESVVMRAGVAGLVWLVGGSLAWASWLTLKRCGSLPMPAESTPGRRDGDLAAVDPLPSSGILRRWLGRFAMLTALVGMAAWLVPEPAGAAVGTSAAEDQWAAAVPRILPWAAATAGWFLALAVPQALLQDGVAGAAAWSRLWRTGATSGRGPRLGAARFAAGVVLTHAAILGWPPLVAAVLSLPSTAASGPPLAIVAGLLVGAGGVAAFTACCARLELSRETQFAVMLGLASALVLLAWHWRPTRPAPTSPSLPILSGVNAEAAAAVGEGISC